MRKINLRKFLIAKGNPTLLVWNCPRAQRKKVVDKYLGVVEQVGFVTNGRLEMMGNELCINAQLALNYSLNPSENTTLRITLSYKKLGQIVFLPGIGFKYSTRKPKNLKLFLEKCCLKYSLPAFGWVYYQKNTITPFVFVKETYSLFKETACGSGSIALNIAKNYANIIQPTGETIHVLRKDNLFKISAKVEEVYFANTNMRTTKSRATRPSPNAIANLTL